MSLEALMGKLDGVVTSVNEIKTAQAEDRKSITDLRGQVSKALDAPNYPNGVTPEDVLKAGATGELGDGPNVPAIRKGNSTMSSEPFSYQRLFAAMGGLIPPEKAKNELHFHNRLRESMVVKSNYYTPNSGGYNGINIHSMPRFTEKGMRSGESFPALAGGQSGSLPGTIFGPLSSEHLPEDVCGKELLMEMKSFCAYDNRSRDRNEEAWLLAKAYNVPIAKTMSWLDSTAGGGLVKPPEQGEIIELLRNKEALSRAGARTIPMPAQGRIVFPRIASPTTAAATVESATITASDLGTGVLVLSPKKIGAIVKLPNELLRYTSQAAESVVRDDLTKTMALTFDFYALEGNGGNDRPMGIINYDNINTITSTVAGVNGDTISPQDPYLHIAAVEEKNAEFEGFIMRPQTLMRFFMFRFATITANDSQGGFAYEFTRGMGNKPVEVLAGYPVTKTAQVNRSQTKGGGTGLTYILGGQWSDFYLAMFGAIEFAVSTQGDSPFQADQTWIRAIMTGDSGPRHEAAFSYQPSMIF